MSGTTPTVSIITPTIGRDSLKVMLSGLLPQLSQGDEVLIIGDGPQPNAKKIVDEIASAFITYWESPPIRNYGNPQRNEAIARAKASHIMFVDDDDTVKPTAIATVKKCLAKHPDDPMMFRMLYGGQKVIWQARKIEVGNVSGQMFITPNVKGRVGTWSGKYTADFDFITSTVALYPKGIKGVRFVNEVITVQGLAGANGAGGREIES